MQANPEKENETMIDWKQNTMTADEHRIAGKIATRFCKLAPGADHMSTVMDIDACNVGGCPLKLAELLAADDFNFAHDVGGINRHIDRETGKLQDCFVPRYAVKQ